MSEGTPIRPSFDEYFMKMAMVAAERSTCVRGKVGAVLVKDNHVIATGYNGPPRGAPHRTEETCIRIVENIPSGTQTERVCCAHAEANAVAQAAMHGHATKDTTLYTLLYPCGYCARFIVNAGVTRIVWKEVYPDDLAAQVLAESKVELVRLDDDIDVQLARVRRGEKPCS